MAPQRAVEVDRGCEQGEGLMVQGGPDGGVHLSSEGEDAVGEGRDDVLLVGVKTCLVHHTQADVALPVAEDAGVEGGHHALAVPARWQQQCAQRSNGEVGQCPRVQGACKHSRGAAPVGGGMALPPGRRGCGHTNIGGENWTSWNRTAHARATAWELWTANYVFGWVAIPV